MAAVDEPKSLHRPLRSLVIDEVPGSGAADRLDALVREEDVTATLRDWFGSDLKSLPKGCDPRALIERKIALLDSILSDQLNAVIHSETFRRLEASWRGLAYLCACGATADNVIVRVLNVSWEELAADFDRAIDFDQSALFQKIYNEGIGMPGGQPFGILLCDYEVQHTRSPGHEVDDIATVSALSGVAAAAFAPAILSASPHLFGLDSFRELDYSSSLSDLFRAAEYRRYNRMRDLDDARFVGLVLPRTLMRAPYSRDGVPKLEFRYREDFRGLSHEEMCWGSAVFALGEVVIRAFHLHGWFADICGARRDEIDNGIVAGIVAPSAETDSPGLVDRFATEVVVPAVVEHELSQQGFMPVNVCKDTKYLVFRSSPSIQTVHAHGDSAADINARISALLRYILCVSRFAHYAKVKIRDRVGAYVTPEECERELQTWLHAFCLGDDNASPEMKARFPLREANVTVRSTPSRPGAFSCVLYLRPHFQLDQVFTTFKLVADLAPVGYQRAF